MKNATLTSKFKVHKTIVTRFTKSSTTSAYSSSILNTSSVARAGAPF